MVIAARRTRFLVAVACLLCLAAAVTLARRRGPRVSLVQSSFDDLCQLSKDLHPSGNTLTIRNHSPGIVTVRIVAGSQVRDLTIPPQGEGKFDFSRDDDWMGILCVALVVVVHDPAIPCELSTDLASSTGILIVRNHTLAIAGVQIVAGSRDQPEVSNLDISPEGEIIVDVPRHEGGRLALLRCVALVR